MQPQKKPKAYTDAEIAREAAKLRSFTDRGIRIILEAPKPVYRYAPFRCADWFNKGNPHCQVAPVTAGEAQAHRAPVLALYSRLRVLTPAIEVWDPFPLLCPTQVCEAVPNGHPIVSDGDHLTGYANDLLTPSFERALRQPSTDSR